MKCHTNLVWYIFYLSFRFQDDDDIFGTERPSSRGRSPASSLKKPDDMDWLLESVTPSKPSTASAATSSATKTSTPLAKSQDVTSADPKPSIQADTQSSVQKPSSQSESKRPATSPAATKPAATPAAKPKSQSDWLGLVDDDDEEEQFSWMKKFNEKPKPQTQVNVVCRKLMLKVFISQPKRSTRCI